MLNMIHTQLDTLHYIYLIFCMNFFYFKMRENSNVLFLSFLLWIYGLVFRIYVGWSVFGETVAYILSNLRIGKTDDSL